MKMTIETTKLEAILERWLEKQDGDLTAYVDFGLNKLSLRDLLNKLKEKSPDTQKLLQAFIEAGIEYLLTTFDSSPELKEGYDEFWKKRRQVPVDPDYFNLGIHMV